MSHCHFVHSKMILEQVILRVHWLYRYLISHIPPTVRINTVFPTIQIYFYGRVATQSSDRIDRVRLGSVVKHVYIIYYSHLLNYFHFFHIPVIQNLKRKLN